MREGLRRAKRMGQGMKDKCRQSNSYPRYVTAPQQGCDEPAPYQSSVTIMNAVRIRLYSPPEDT